VEELLTPPDPLTGPQVAPRGLRILNPALGKIDFKSLTNGRVVSGHQDTMMGDSGVSIANPVEYCRVYCFFFSSEVGVAPSTYFF